MRYVLKLLRHGCILLGRVGWILFGALFTFLGAIAHRGEDSESAAHNPAALDKPDFSDWSHPNWEFYWGDGQR